MYDYELYEKDTAIRRCLFFGQMVMIQTAAIKGKNKIRCSEESCNAKIYDIY